MQYLYNQKSISLAKELRKNMTKEERHLWYDFLREYPVRFRRQKAFGNYIVDFYCAAAKIVVELDGSQHYTPTQQQYDLERSAFLEKLGLSIIRIPNNAVTENFPGVCEHIDNCVRQTLSNEGETPPARL